MKLLPPPYKSVNAALEEVRAMRVAALAKATETLLALLDHPSGAIRLAAAEALANRVEGKPTQRVEVSGPDSEEQSERAAIRALFSHWIATTPELFSAALDWAKSVHAGSPAIPPAGLLPPSSEPARGLWNRLQDASRPAPALVEAKACP